MNRERLGNAIALGALGLVYGCLIALIALLLGGAGHGWGSPLISATGVFLLPAFGVAQAFPRQIRATVLMLLAAGMLLTDALLALATWAEGTEYVFKAWAAFPWAVLLWAALWGGWQAALLDVLRRDLLAARSDASSAMISPPGEPDR
jgi:hypothetical protein